MYYLIALRTAIFNVDDARAAVLGEQEGVAELVVAQATDVCADLVLDLLQTSPRFRCLVDVVYTAVDVF